MNYLPLYVKTEYSLLESMITIDSLISFAKENNLKSLTITDNNMYGAMEFYTKCVKNNIKPVIGLEIKIDNTTLILYAKDDLGYKNLIKLSSIDRTLKLEDLKEYSKSLILIVPFQYISLFESIKDYYEISFVGYDREIDKSNIKYNKVFFSKACYFTKEDIPYYKYLLAIKDGHNIERVDYSLDESIKLGIYEEANILINSLCNLKLEKELDLLPVYDCPNKMSSEQYLRDLCREGLKKIFGERVNKIYVDRLKYELDVINKMGFANYFLVVWDYVKYAKENGILVGPGRGSAAGSLVSFCLNITTVDPIKYNLLFERFLNPERITMPDIDIDFEDKRREEVINYCINKYGYKKVVGIITFGTLGSKQIIRDVGRANGNDVKVIDYLAKMLDSKLTLQQNYNTSKKLQDYLRQDPDLTKIYAVAIRLEGLKRHTSVHAAGIVMSSKDLDEVIPIVKNHEGFYTTAYSMEYLEDLGLLKMDFLGLRNLTLIEDVISNLNKDSIKIDFDKIPMDDEKAYKIFENVNTIGIFQFESSGMTNFLRKFKPNNFEDISSAIALFRPGPMDNIDLYIKRKKEKESIDYFHPNLKPILEPTYGIIVYQEQIMQIASVMAGYSLGEADVLRRAMSKKKEDVLISERNKFIQRSNSLGYSLEVGNKVYDLIVKFAAYGFNRAHSVAYSLISYRMAYLKANYPKYFMKSLLSMVIGSEVKTKEYIYEARLNNIDILKPDINLSNEYYKIEEFGVRYPLTNIKNVGINGVRTILEERDKNKYKDIFDFLVRTYGKSVNRKTIESLIDASAFSSFGLNKATLHHNLEKIINYADIAVDDTVLKPEIDIIKEYDKKDILAKENEIFGFYLSSHPITDYKIRYPGTINIKSINEYFDKNIDILIYVDTLREVQTKNKETMLFVGATDEINNIDVVLFPRVYEKYPKIKKDDILLVNAKVEKRFDKYQLIANEITKIN
jgi:DNA polymerase III subunit alpha